MTQADSLETLAAQLGEHLQNKQWYLVTAESCTGGYLAQTITSIPGSSAWYERGFVTYSNIAKQEMLTVSSKTLGEHGAVSTETALEMAEGALQHSHAELAIAITGIAGPAGGDEKKPVGTVYFALASTDSFMTSFCQHFAGDRQQIREQAVQYALQQLLGYLQKTN